jgi:hypothetical protein
VKEILKPKISVYNFLLLKQTFRKTGKVQVIKPKKLVKSIVGNEPFILHGNRWGWSAKLSDVET